MARHRISIVGLMAFVLVIAVGMTSLRSPSHPLAAGTFLVTLVVMAWSLLAAIYRRGERRAYWLGFALFGWGYIGLAWGTWWDGGAERPELFTSMILERLRLHAVFGWDLTGGTFAAFSPLLEAPGPRDKVILSKLEDSISMSFANEVPLEDVLTYIKSATTGLADNGIPIYVDPVGLREAGKSMTSEVALDMEGVPLRVTLGLLLRQVGLTYYVRDGLLTITTDTSRGKASRPFRRIGHCYWALLFAWFGGRAGCSLYRTRETAPE